jgi:hypothetical protein
LEALRKRSAETINRRNLRLWKYWKQSRHESACAGAGAGAHAHALDITSITSIASNVIIKEVHKQWLTRTTALQQMHPQ